MRLNEDGSDRPDERVPIEPVLPSMAVRFAIAAISAALAFIVPVLCASAASPRGGVGAFGPAHFWDRDALLLWWWVGILPGTFLGCGAWASISSCGRLTFKDAIAVVAVGSTLCWFGMARLVDLVGVPPSPWEEGSVEGRIAFFCATAARIAGPGILIAGWLGRWLRLRDAG